MKDKLNYSRKIPKVSQGNSFKIFMIKGVWVVSNMTSKFWTSEFGYTHTQKLFRKLHQIL